MTGEKESSSRVLRRRSQNPVVISPPKVNKRISKLSVEDIYLQKDFIPSRFVGSSLETIYECPKSKSAGNTGMGLKKLRRKCKFTPYNPPVSKITKRANRATMLKKLRNHSGKQFPVRKAKNDIISMEYENSITDINSNAPTTSFSDENCSSVTSDPVLNLDNFTTSFSSSLFLSDDRSSCSKENSVFGILPDMELDFNNFSLNKAKYSCKKKRRITKQYSRDALKGACENNKENSTNDCHAKRKTQKSTEDLETSSNCENPLKRFHSLPNNRNKFSGICGTVSLDYYTEDKTLSPMELSPENTKLSPIYNNVITCREIDYTEIPIKAQLTCMNNRTSRDNHNYDICRNALTSNSQIGQDSNLSLSPILFDNTNLCDANTHNNRNRRRSARLSMRQEISHSTLGSMWLDE